MDLISPELQERAFALAEERLELTKPTNSTPAAQLKPQSTLLVHLLLPVADGACVAGGCGERGASCSLRYRMSGGRRLKICCTRECSSGLTAALQAPATSSPAHATA